MRIFSELRNCLEENDCTVCFGTMDDRVSGPLQEDEDWPRMVRHFYELADRKKTIDHIALSAILCRFFFAPPPKVKKRSNVWVRICLQLQEIIFCGWIPCQRPHKRPQSKAKPVDRTLVLQISQQLISRVSVNKSSQIQYEQFRTIIRDVQQWQAVFQLYDLDQSGHLDRKELKSALNSSGFNVNNRVLHELMKRSRESRVEGMELVDFVLCAVESRNAIEKLQQNVADDAERKITDKKAV